MKPFASRKDSAHIHSFANLILFFIFSLLFTLKSFAQQSKIDSLLGILNTVEDTLQIKTLNEIALELSNSRPERSLEYSQKALLIAQKLNNKKFIAHSEHQIAWANYIQGNYSIAIEHNLKAMKLREEIGDKKAMAISYNNIGIIYKEKGDYDKALEFHFKSLKIKEEIGNKKGMAGSYNNIGEIYRQNGYYDKALEFYFKAVKINEELGNKNWLAINYNNIGIIHNKKGDNDKSMEFYFKALSFREQIGDKIGMAASYNNIGLIHKERGEYGKALELFLKSLNITEELGDKNGMVISYLSIGFVFINERKFSEAREYLNKGLVLSKEIGAKELTKSAYTYQSQLDSIQGNWKGAYEYHKLYSAIKDSIFNEESSKQITEMSTKYETEKKEQQIKLIKTEQEKQAAVAAAESKKQKIIIWSVISGLLLVLVFAVFIFRSLRASQKQKHIIEEQKLLVEEKHREISDSINYAERIQRALLASKKLLDENLSNYFILFKPKDVVSGDFYWATKLRNNHFVLVTADSTGHGVPGAIMSILNIACLKEAVSKGITSPDLLLNESRQLVIENLKNDGSNEGGKDGMDGNLLSFDFKNNVLYCASANNPIWIIRNSELIEIKPDRMPIGKHEKDKIPFSLQTLNIQKGDVVYTLTDGFADQFGGANGKKFKYKQLQELLLSITQEKMEIQKQKLNYAFDDWKGNLEQIDDVTIIGIRI